MPLTITRSEIRAGIISDTHGLLRPEVINALAGVDCIIHAGDIGEKEILHELEMIAPVLAVRGNTDRLAWNDAIPMTDVADVGGILIYVIHDLELLDLDPASTGIKVVVHGHTHKPAFFINRDVLFFNPGSAGPRRFSLPISVGFLTIRHGTITPELTTLHLGAGR